MKAVAGTPLLPTTMTLTELTEEDLQVLYQLGNCSEFIAGHLKSYIADELPVSKTKVDTVLSAFYDALAPFRLQLTS